MPDWCENKLYVSPLRGNKWQVEHFSRCLQSDVKGMHKKVAPKRKEGKCTYWNEDRGFGFLAEDTYDIWDDYDDYDSCQGDIFVHCSELHANGAKMLRKGECVEFDLVLQSDDRRKAINVTGPGGRYVRGNGAFHNNSRTANPNAFDLKLECYGFEQVTNEQAQPIKQSEGKPDVAEITRNMSRLNLIVDSAETVFTFSTKFCPPTAWLQSVSKRHSVSLHLTYQYEEPPSSGYVTAQNGEITNRFQIENYVLFEENMGEFVNVMEEEAQNIFNEAVTQNLQDVMSSSTIDVILEYSPQYRLERLSSTFNNVWNLYSEGKEMTVAKDCVVTDLFSAIQQRLEMVFSGKALEILDRRGSILFGFWDCEYGYFKEINECFLNDQQAN